MDIGRIYFDPPNSSPTKARIIPLETHVGNVQQLVETWSHDRAYRVPADCNLEMTRQKLIEAARRHDEAKPVTFKVTADSHKYGYSFAGHRFRVQCADLYTDLLIKRHHDFSVDEIAECQARLHREVGDVYARNFPLDLYTLEMCDQVAAEAESYAMEGKSDERAFMELHSRKREDGSIEVEPFPFGQSPLVLTVNFYEYEIPSDILTGEKPTEKLTIALKAWMPDKAYEQKKKVTLCQP